MWSPVSAVIEKSSIMGQSHRAGLWAECGHDEVVLNSSQVSR